MKRKLLVPGEFPWKVKCLQFAQSLAFGMYEAHLMREDFYKILHWEMK
jgi:hypothetical protein